jgi:adenine-specific DNA-methyltransferase
VRYRTNDKFHIPLVHPVTGKECPVPPNGWSRAPETLQALIENDEILFGTDETTQPQKKVFLTEDSKRQVSSVIEETGRGKQDVLALGVEFPYCHPVSLYETLLGGAVPDDGFALDYYICSRGGSVPGVAAEGC